MQERLEWLRSTLLPMAIRYKSIDVQSSGASDRMAEVSPEIVGLEKTSAEYVEKLAEHQREAERIISRIERPEYRMLLRMYYLHYPQLTWRQVADKMNYTIESIYNMHGRALLEAGKVIRTD